VKKILVVEVAREKCWAVAFGLDCIALHYGRVTLGVIGSSGLDYSIYTHIAFFSNDTHYSYDKTRFLIS
jgi:hypothetical protein